MGTCPQIRANREVTQEQQKQHVTSRAEREVSSCSISRALSLRLQNAVVTSCQFNQQPQQQQYFATQLFLSNCIFLVMSCCYCDLNFNVKTALARTLHFAVCSPFHLTYCRFCFVYYKYKCVPLRFFSDINHNNTATAGLDQTFLARNSVLLNDFCARRR